MHTNIHYFFFGSTRLVAHIMAEENVNAEDNEHVTNNERKQSLERKKRIDVLLSDKEL